MTQIKGNNGREKGARWVDPSPEAEEDQGTKEQEMKEEDQVAASMAAQKANGLWVDDRKLPIKTADYGKENGESKWMKPTLKRKFEGQTVAENYMKKRWNQGIDRRSFVVALKGVNSVGKHNTTINVVEIGNGWLYESLILRLESMYYVLAIKEELKRKEMTGVLVREGGGRDVMITFKSKEELRNNRSKIIAWFQDWSVFIKEWSSDLHLEQERFVWLNCYGIPLNLWNTNTFRKIGRLWGEGRAYSMRVCEELIVKEVKATCKCNLVDGDEEYVNSNVNGEVQPNAEPRLEKDEDDLADVVADDVEVTNELVERDLPTRRKEGGEVDAEGNWMEVSIVEETADYMGKSNKAAKSKIAADIGKAIEEGTREAETMMKEKREDYSRGVMMRH
ncbi:hypothetical protein ACSBR1_006274 [Camellia fascicularis]